MRRIVLSLVLVFATSTASAAWNRSVEPVKGDPERIGRSRHYIVPASQELREGMEAVQPLGGGRQLVRVAPGISVDASFERLTAGRKIDRQAVRAAVAGRAE